MAPTPATTHSQNEEYFNFYHPCLFKIQKKKKKKKKSQTWCLRCYKFLSTTKCERTLLTTFGFFFTLNPTNRSQGILPHTANIFYCGKEKCFLEKSHLFTSPLLFIRWAASQVFFCVEMGHFDSSITQATET